jgi:tRNA (guanine-N7-)-methyltransferase
MGHKKLIRFEEIKGFQNVLIYPPGMPGKWNDYFQNDYPIVLELACGKGDYTLGLSKLYRQRNFIGVDIKGNRIWKGAKTALEDRIKNVAFLRTQIEEISNYFEFGEVAEIWITFPDPFLRLSKSKKRLTHKRFLQQYYHILSKSGVIHLKTDSRELYEFTLETITDNGCHLLEEIPDIYSQPSLTPELTIQTYYEKMHLVEGRQIGYIKFSLSDELVHTSSIISCEKAID